MKKILLIAILGYFLFSCEKENDFILEPNTQTELIFVANEGNFGASNGSISVIGKNGIIQTIQNVGDVVQSLLVNKNKLFVSVNNSHKIKIYDITENGILLPGIEVDTKGSSPREMVIFDNKLYFTNWNTQDIKVLDLFTYSIIKSIPVNGLPESIVTDGSNLYVGIMMNSDYSDASEVVKVNPITNNISEIYDVDKGPTSLMVKDNQIYIARTYYDSNWNASYGTSMIELQEDRVNIQVMNYGAGVVCGGSIHSFKGNPYRSFKGGVAMLEKDLSIKETSLIGEFDETNIYSVETIGDKVYIGTLDGFVKVYNEFNQEIESHKVGEFPGDFEYWINE